MLGIKLLNAFHHDDHLEEMWNDTRCGGYSFQTGILDSYVDQNGNRNLGKNHPNSILVDWMARACMAMVAPAQFQNENDFNESEVEEIAEIWKVVCNQPRGSATIIDVDDSAFINKVALHWEKRNGKL